MCLRKPRIFLVAPERIEGSCTHQSVRNVRDIQLHYIHVAAVNCTGRVRYDTHLV